MAKKRNKKTDLSKHSNASAPPKVDSVASGHSSSRASSPDKSEAKQLHDETSEEATASPSLLTYLEESFASVLSSQARLKDTMQEQGEYLKRKKMERWCNQIGRPWLNGEDSIGEKLFLDGKYDYSILPPELRGALKVENSLPKERRAAYFKAWQPDVAAIEMVLNKVVDGIAKEWKDAPEGEFKEIISLVYGLCSMLKARLGLEHNLAAEPLHSELVERFGTKLFDMVMANPADTCTWIGSYPDSSLGLMAF